MMVIRASSAAAVAAKPLARSSLHLHLGPLPLIEQRFRVSKGTHLQQQHPQQAKLHPQEFVLIAPADVDEVIDLYFERQADLCIGRCKLAG